MFLKQLNLSRKPKSPVTKLLGKAKATCARCIWEAKIFALQLSGMQRPMEPPRLAQFRNHMPSLSLHLEGQAIEEESRSQLDFLSACQTALQASPAELCSVLVASYQVLMGQLLMSLPLNPSQGASSSELSPTPMAPSLPALEPSPKVKWQCLSPDPVDVFLLAGPHPGKHDRSP